MSGHFLGSRASVGIVVAPQDKHAPPLPLAFSAEQTSYFMEYPLGQFGSAVLGLSPPKILPTPSLLGEGGNAGETALMLWSTAQQQPKHRDVTNTFLATNTKHSITRAARAKLTPSQPDTIQLFI